MNLVAVIPARLQSTRFPRKVLFEMYGLPVLEHVRRRALLADGISDAVVATCDAEIADVVRSFGGKVVMTSASHTNGTTRSAEAAETIACTHVMLVQGDEPLVVPDDLTTLARAMTAEPSVEAWNSTGPIEHEEDLDRHSLVKCAVTHTGRIMYCFRRSPNHSPFSVQQRFVRKLQGIMGYRKDFLRKLVALEPSAVEVAESIEQMRIIENGFELRSVAVASSPPSINETTDVGDVEECLAASAQQAALLRRVTE